jgi:pilus assembly protein CpaB
MATTSVPTAAPVTSSPVNGAAVGRRGPLRQGLGGRVSRGHVVMVVAGLVGVVVSFAALRQHDGAARVMVASHEIRAGERVSADDFRTEAVTMSAPLLATVVRAREVDGVVGRIAGATMAEGEIISKRMLRPRAARAGQRAMSIPIDPARAVGGRLAAGDRVDVLFAGERAVSIIVADAEVLAVDARGRGGIGESASPFTVTIAVTARQSQLVAAAVADGNISLARTTGSVSSKGTAPESLDRVDEIDSTAR